MPGYAELHAHSCWSLREGASSSDELVGRAVALGYGALAITDHDNLYGAMEYARAARGRGLKPITGGELTLTRRNIEDRVPGPECSPQSSGLNPAALPQGVHAPRDGRARRKDSRGP